MAPGLWSEQLERGSCYVQRRRTLQELLALWGYLKFEIRIKYPSSDVKYAADIQGGAKAG